MDLNADFHGIPLKYWLVGASATGFVGFILYRRRQAAKAAAAQGTSGSGTAGATGPLPGWAGLANALGPLGGSSPTGPLTGYTSSGEPVYGTIRDSWRRRHHDGTPAPPGGNTVSIPPGEIPTPPPPPPAVPTPVAPSVSAPPPPAVASYAQILPNPIPGDTSTVIGGLLGGSPFTYGGSASEANNIISQVGSTLTLPPASGVGQRYVLPDGTSFVYG